MSPPSLPGRRLPRPVREFLHTESAGGVVLLVGALVALVWANSPWQHSYTSLWETEVRLEIGRLVVTESLRHWVNDGLMALFFFVVGLEIKRELVHGELRSLRTAALPIVGALGGMVVPALIYLAVNAGGPGVHGWGVPMATDIAFAVGVVALLGPRVPTSLKLFLLTLAVADDLGAIVVIALFYASGVDATALAVAAGLVVAIEVLRRAEVTWMPGFVVLGVGVWLATLASGVHATIAGVVMGLLTPAHPLAPARLAREWAEDLADEPTPEELLGMTRLAKESVSVAERLAHHLHPLTSFVIVPIFALANAGVTLSPSALSAPGTSAVALGVALGLVAGKAIGITTASWLAVRLGLGALPSGVGWRHMAGIAAVAGIGFTVSLFVAGLAYDEEALEGAAKVGILAGSLVAAVGGSTVLASACRSWPLPAPDEAVHDLAPAAAYDPAEVGAS
ncbi:MAG TPA: Na+/H+ antiporter NhaA [Acidimicrobiales bacterium]|nr:Na+/H+ antiporter NhaA [Acidimicrobiales bacterium]